MGMGSLNTAQYAYYLFVLGEIDTGQLKYRRKYPELGWWNE